MTQPLKLDILFLGHTAVLRRTNKFSNGDKSIYLDGEKKKTGTEVLISRSNIKRSSSVYFATFIGMTNSRQLSTNRWRDDNYTKITEIDDTEREIHLTQSMSFSDNFLEPKNKC